MASPFKVFRQHQKWVLAGLTVMAMIAFGVGDIVLRMTRGRSAEGGEVVVEINTGGLNQMAINRLLNHRRVANQFLSAAYRVSHPEFERQIAFFQSSPQLRMFMPQLEGQIRAIENRFGPATPQDVVFAHLHRFEARKMGLVVDDKQIETFIAQATEDKLSTDQFRKIVHGMQISPKDLYDVLRDELLSLYAFRMMVPVSPSSPEQYWKYFQQLHTRVKLEFTALPIKDFTGLVPDPSDAEIAKFFEAHKTTYESAGDGEYQPGFRQPHKARLHYLKADFSDAEEEAIRANPVTDKDVEDYYEKNKDKDSSLFTFEIPGADENSPLSPDFAPEKKSDEPASEKDSEKKDPESKDDADSKPKADAEKTEPKESKEESNNGCGAADEEEGRKDEKTDKPVAKDDDAKDEEKSEKPAAAKDRPDPPATPESPEEPGTGKDDTDAPKPPAKKYKPLDDELRGVIKDKIGRERGLAALKTKAEKAADALRNVGLEFSKGEFNLASPKKEDLPRLQEKSKAAFEKIGSEFGMEFGDTGLLNPRDMSELKGIGEAQEPGTNEFMAGGATTVVDVVFATKNETLCRVFIAEDQSTNDWYVYWKVEDAAAHIPQLADPGIREQVISQWKMQEAIPLAKKRGEELAEAIRKSKESMSEALGEQTVTGDKKSTQLAVRETQEFSWFTESTAPPTSMAPRQPTVQMGRPIGIHAAGDKLMHGVFDGLKKDEVGAVLNDDASIYYVVRVIDRRDASRDGFKDTPLFGFGSPYDQLAQFDQRSIRVEYDKQLEKKYAVKWKDSAALEQIQSGGDE